MRIEALADAESVARAAAAFTAAEACAAVSARGRFVVALSGGHTAWQMLRALAQRERNLHCARLHRSAGAKY
jgi:6-phosphogluconolactonase